MIALVITIIIMLILVAIAVTVVLNNGLFDYAKDATNKWNEAQESENNLGNDPITINGKEYSSLDEYIKELNGDTSTPGNSTNPKVKIGDYVNYKPDTVQNYKGLGSSSNQRAGSTNNPEDGIPQDTSLKWKILSLNSNGSIDIISENPTETKVYFYGAIGYNNGVYLLNDLCKNLYSNTTLNVTARSINLSDIESKINSTGIIERNKYTQFESKLQYGNSKKYTGENAYSPDIFTHVGQSTKEESIDYYTTPTTETAELRDSFDAKQTFYQLSVPTTYMDDSDLYNMIFNTSKQYWLASRFADCYSEHVGFGLRFINVNSIGGSTLRYLGFVEHDTNCSVRPVVTLDSNIKFSGGDGTKDLPWNLSK